MARKTVDGKFHMHVTALDDCPKCMGTGIAMESAYSNVFYRVEVQMFVCTCVRVIPRMTEVKTQAEAAEEARNA